jgi:hypothetical protein
MTVRMWVPDVWDNASVLVVPEDSVAAVKARGLEQITGRSADTTKYQLKFRGALVTDESQTLAELGVPDGAPLIILSASRRPVR